MRIYQGIILGTILLRYLLLFFEWWSLQRKTELPAELSDVTTPEQFTKINEYTRVKTKFHLIQATFGLIVMLVFWFSGGFNAVDHWVRSFSLSTIPTGILYIGILGMASSILSLPFDLYSTFVIEERFGFNKATLKLFIADRLKGLALAIVLGTPLLWAILWFFQRAGSYAWLYCWLVSVGFSVALQYLAPVWILRMFNKYTPLPEGDLREAIFAYAEKVRFPLKEIFVMDASKRSTKSNAFFTGFGKNRRIALFDTLVSGSTNPEIVSVLAHEVGHYKKKHIFHGMLINLFYMGFVFYLLSIFINREGLFDAFYMDYPSVYAGLVFFGLLFEPLSFLTSIAFNALSRRNENQADQYAIETTLDRQNLISALKKLYSNNLSNLTPHPLYVFLNYTHPPLLERIRRIRSSEELRSRDAAEIVN
jgi:STE24 endopeptidase